MSAPNSFVLTAVGGGTGVYTGTFPGGASNRYAGMWVTFSGFANAANNGTFQVTASSATTLTTTNSGSIAETHAGVAVDFTPYICLDPAGFPSTVASVATNTGSQWSSRFGVLCRPDGSARKLKLSISNIVGALSAFVCDLYQSVDGGLTWQVFQAAMDLFNSPVIEVSPDPSPGAIYMLNVVTFTGGTSASVIGSSA